MPKNNVTLNEACFRLNQLIRNPYAVARYLAKPKQVEDQWSALAQKLHVSYRRSKNA